MKTPVAIPNIPTAYARRLVATATAALVVAAIAAAVGCQQPDREGTDYARAHYTKEVHRIAMRDGVRLYTTVYRPKDRSTTYPILMFRTPYSSRPYGDDAYPRRLGPNPSYMREGFIFVYQDVRGAYMSEGTFVNMRPHKRDKRGPTDIDESSDTYDT
ncbi:MAG: CocE/NonD family hydrolase, partial [Myxococcota bacterium]